MAERSEWLYRTLPRAWILILIAVGVVLSWQAYQILPGWIENVTMENLSRKGVVVTALPVEEVGFRQSRIGRGGLVVGEHSMEWESIDVGYQFGDLMAGKVSTVQVNQPVVSIGFPAINGTALTEPATESDPSPVPASTVPAPAPSGAGETIPSPTLPEIDRGPPVSLWRQLQDLPVETLGFHQGVLEFMLQDEAFMHASLRAVLEQQPYGTSGEIHIKGSEVAAHLSVRAPAVDPVVTFQGEISMPPSSIREIANGLIELRKDCDRFPRLAASGQLMMDVFAEVTEDNTFYGSYEASVAELALRLPGTESEIGLNRLLLAGVYKDQRFDLEGGTEFILPRTELFNARPFNVRFSWHGAGRLNLETEAIDWAYGPVEGRCALKGQAFPGLFPADGWARLESSFPFVNLGKVRAQPFSFLFQSAGDEVRLKASPIGLDQSGSLWIEDLAGFWNSVTGSGSAGFNWYGLVGESMGRVETQLEKEADGAAHATYSLLGPSGEEFLAGSLALSGRDMAVDLDGELPLSWVKTIASWFDTGMAKLDGPNPGLSLQFKGRYPLFFGQGELDLRGVNIELGGGTRLEQVEGPVSFALNFLPTTDGPQHTRIGRVSGNSLLLQDVEIDWEMPLISQISVSRLVGRVGEGTIELEPFSINPLVPKLSTTVKVKHLDADLLRQWLGEDRFKLMGLISGQFSIGWENGELLLGGGSFTMDAENSPGRFIFVDQEFLREQFASFSGVPVELRDRLLDALLSKGIRIDTLEVTLGPAAEAGRLLFRVAISGESKSELLEVPIKGFVINNLISEEDLGQLLGVMSPVRVRAKVGN